MGKEVKVAIAGIGNCASAFVQGIHYYRERDDRVGLIFPEIGGYKPQDVVPVAAFDVDARKVGNDLSHAINAQPNCTLRFQDVPPLGVPVLMGPREDGVPLHLARFVSVADRPSVDVAAALRDAGADLLLNLLPTGSAAATRVYAEAAIHGAGIGFINGIPELIAGDPAWAEAASRCGVPLIGDDFKSQVGTTILNRAMIKALIDRGVRLEQMYQYNFAGNTDFANLEHRGESKEITKRSSLQALLPYEVTWGLAPMFINGQDDTKTGVIRVVGRYWAGNRVTVEVRLEVNDSADAAGVMIDMVRFAKLAMDHGVGGVSDPVCSFYAKRPPHEIADQEAVKILSDLANARTEDTLWRALWHAAVQSEEQHASIEAV